ncbi:hypothetical protein [Methylobacterium fujisawaense]|uniref:hypothetical protein n=1 Tax=Methylobacterium fujisawaense TaxID=107400 RepID=UPI00313C66B2
MLHVKNTKTPASSFPLDVDWEALSALSKLIRYDSLTKTLTVANGKARIVLDGNGVIWIEGKRVVQRADEDLSVNAAWIRLN